MCRRIKNKKRYWDEEYTRVSLYEINKALNLDWVTDPEKIVPKE